MPIGYIVETEFLWGFQANVIGLSKTPPSFYYPPPTTFLGALAEVLAKEHGIGEERGKEIIPAISRNLSAIGVKPVNCFPVKYEDINRIITVKKTSGRYYPDPKDLAKSFDAPARGKTILISLNEEPPKLKWFIVFRDSTLEFNDRKIVLDENIFWKIHRLGSKESIVSITNVIATEKPDIAKGSGVTNYSFPLVEGVYPEFHVSEAWEYEIYVKPFGLRSYDDIVQYIAGKNTLPYMVPLKKTMFREARYRVKLGKNLVLYRLGEEVIVGYG